MGIRNFFYKDHPPVSGKAKKLWDWFIKEFDVENQDSLFLSINHPGMWQRSQGTSDYCIVYFGSDYVCNVNEIDDIVHNKHKEDYKRQFRDTITNIYYL